MAVLLCTYTLLPNSSIANQRISDIHELTYSGCYVKLLPFITCSIKSCHLSIWRVEWVNPALHTPTPTYIHVCTCIYPHLHTFPMFTYIPAPLTCTHLPSRPPPLPWPPLPSPALTCTHAYIPSPPFTSQSLTCTHTSTFTCLPSPPHIQYPHFPSPTHMPASPLIYIHIHIYTSPCCYTFLYTSTHLHTPTHSSITPPHMHTPTYMYLHPSSPVHISLHLSSLTHTSPHLPTPPLLLHSPPITPPHLHTPTYMYMYLHSSSCAHLPSPLLTYTHSHSSLPLSSSSAHPSYHPSTCTHLHVQSPFINCTHLPSPLLTYTHLPTPTCSNC